MRPTAIPVIVGGGRETIIDRLTAFVTAGPKLVADASAGVIAIPNNGGAGSCAELAA